MISKGRIGASKVLKLIECAKGSIGITTGIDAAVLEKTYILEDISNLVFLLT